MGAKEAVMKEAVMDDDPKRNSEPPPAGAVEQSQAADPRVVRALDMTNDDIAAIAASEMAPGCEHLHAELDDD